MQLEAIASCTPIFPSKMVNSECKITFPNALPFLASGMTNLERVQEATWEVQETVAVGLIYVMGQFT